MKNGLSVLLIAVTLSACNHFGLERDHGDKINLDTQIDFVGEDGTPVAAAPIYIMETLGNITPVITDTLKTDSQGVLHLRGNYCSPVGVATNGGGIFIHRETLQAHYTVTVRKNRQPSLEKGYGLPRPDLAAFKQSRTYKNCGA